MTRQAAAIRMAGMLGATRRLDRRRLAVALAVSLAAHVVALGLSFTAPAPARPAPREPGLEVVLLNAGTRSTPAKAQLLAQVNSDGGGDAERGHAQAPVASSDTAQDGEPLARLRQRLAALEAQQNLLAAQLEQARLRTAANPPGTPAQGQADAAQTDQLMRQFAEISKRVDDYNKRPRTHFVAPATAEYRYAAYVDAWRRRIETIGTENYPEEARGHVYGSLRMTVYIRSDGSLQGVDIDKPSEHKMLNDAARRIVALATPFPPFPPQIARDTDVLAITRTWTFTNDKLVARSN